MLTTSTGWTLTALAAAAVAGPLQHGAAPWPAAGCALKPVFATHSHNKNYYQGCDGRLHAGHRRRSLVGLTLIWTNTLTMLEYLYIQAWSAVLRGGATMRPTCYSTAITELQHLQCTQGYRGVAPQKCARLLLTDSLSHSNSGCLSTKTARHHTQRQRPQLSRPIVLDAQAC